MIRSPLRPRIVMSALGALCTLAMLPANASLPSSGDLRTVEVDGYGVVTFRLSDLRAAEERVRVAAPADRDEVIRSLDPALAKIAVWDMSYVAGTDIMRGVARVVPFGPCYEAGSCDRGVPNEENEPPADPPSSAPHVPPPPPVRTCYSKEDSRTLRTGWFIKGDAYTFTQRMGYCVVGQLVEPGPWIYSFYSVKDELWECQDAEDNNDIAIVATPNTVEAHSDGKCTFTVGITLPNVDIKLGHATPSITDVYGIDGSRLMRSGSSH